MRHILLSRIFLAMLCIALPSVLSAMEFSIERLDLRPIRPPSLHITATGPIERGDTEKLKATLLAADKDDVRDVLFIFDSPGGNLMESLEMGSYIADIPAIVTAQVGSTGMSNAICASACVYAYLAADYRYVSNDARIGVHRFGFYDIELDGNEGAALGQAVSGILSEYIRTHRAEPEFFEAISLIDHDDILWVPTDKLERWRVVNNGIYDEQAAYINLNGKAALRLKQVAKTGDSYLTLFCTDNGVAGLADLHEPDLAAYGQFEIAIDDGWHPVRQWDIVDRSKGRGRIVFEMPSALRPAALRAEKIGARMVAPSGDIFFGFQQTLRDGLVPEMIRNCPDEPQHSAPTMVELRSTDFPGRDLTTSGIKDISFAQCKAICLEYADCKAVSYVQRRSWCWPKGGVSRRRRASGIISAYKN